MKRSAIETLLGAFVLAVAGFFLVFSYQTANVGSVSGGRMVTADFSGIGGLKPGDDVVISGVKVGTVTSVDLIPDTFLARVYMEVQSGLQLPVDTAALISSESLLGGRYLALEPGADEEMIPDGGRIQFTQAPQNLEQLLGQFIFSMKDDPNKKKAEGGAAGAASEAAPAPPVLEHPVPEKIEEPVSATPSASPAEKPAPAPDESSAAPPSDEPEPAHP